MRLARKLPLPIYGSFHAPHLPLPDLYAIIGESELLDRPVRTFDSLLHPRLQGHLDVVSLRELLIRGVGDILQAPLNIDDDTQSILQRTQDHDVQLTSIGPARMSHLERALNPVGVHRLGSRQLQSRNSSVDRADYEADTCTRFQHRHSLLRRPISLSVLL